jgi:hypothetical protein
MRKQPKTFSPEIRIKSLETRNGEKIYWAEFKARTCFFFWDWYEIRSCIIEKHRVFTSNDWICEPFENKEYCQRNAEAFVRHVNKRRLEKWGEETVKIKIEQ